VKTNLILKDYDRINVPLRFNGQNLLFYGRKVLYCPILNVTLQLCLFWTQIRHYVFIVFIRWSVYFYLFFLGKLF